MGDLGVWLGKCRLGGLGARGCRGVGELGIASDWGEGNCMQISVEVEWSKAAEKGKKKLTTERPGSEVISTILMTGAM